MDNSPAVAFMKDDEGRYVYVNKPFEKVFGQKLSFLKGRTSLTGCRRSAPPTLTMTISRCWKAAGGVSSLPAGDGKLRHWLVFKFPRSTPPDDGTSRASALISANAVASKKRWPNRSSAKRKPRISQAIRCSLDSHEIYRTCVNWVRTSMWIVVRCS